MSLSVPALAAGQSPDARLLQLDRELEPLYAQAMALRPAHKQAMAAFRDSADHADHLLAGRDAPKDEKAAGLSAYFALIDAEMADSDADDVCDRMEAIWEQTERLLHAVLETTATTAAGAAVKARALAFESLELWDRPARDLDWTEHLTRDLIEATLRVAGASLPGEPTHV